MSMITSETPYKLAEIIRDTWPQLYYLKDARKPGTRREGVGRGGPDGSGQSNDHHTGMGND